MLHGCSAAVLYTLKEHYVYGASVGKSTRAEISALAENLPIAEWWYENNVGVPGNLLWRDRAVSVLSLLSWSVLKVQQ